MRSRKRQNKSGFWAGVVAGLLLSCMGFAAWSYVATPSTALARSGPQLSESEPPTISRPVHVLVLGVDERPGDPGRSDTMMLVRFDKKQVRVLSIPRDTLVDMGEHGEGKANSAYTYGGEGLAMQTIGNLVGVTVDYAVKVNTAGFRHLVDLMGGVWFDVPKAMQYEDPTDGLKIDLKPGKQLLDGAKAEQFVRFRHDELGDDVSRIHRQQEFLKEAVRQALTPANLAKLPQLLYAARTYVQTDIPLAEQIKLAHTAYKAHQQGAVIQETLPGRGDYVSGISFFLVDHKQLDRLLSTWYAAGGEE